MRAALIALVCLLAATGVRANGPAFHDGNKALELCSMPQNSAYCLGYVAGLFDGLAAYNRNDYCPPANVTMFQVRDIFVSDLRAMPQSRHLGASSILYASMIIAFPCRR